MEKLHRFILLFSLYRGSLLKKILVWGKELFWGIKIQNSKNLFPKFTIFPILSHSSGYNRCFFIAKKFVCKHLSTVILLPYIYAKVFILGKVVLDGSQKLL